MSDQLVAERTAILADLAAIETAITDLADVLGSNLNPQMARRLAELLHINKVAERGRLVTRLAAMDAALRAEDKTRPL